MSLSRWNAPGHSQGSKSKIARNGVQKSAHGVRRCVVVGVHVAGTDFYSDEEIELLRQRLRSFLKSRATINSQFDVEMIRR